MKNWLSIGLGVIPVAACLAWGWAVLFPAPSYSYVHVVAHLMHGNEPVTLDWVGQCRFRQRGGEMRAYVAVTVAPYVYGVATRDGGMVLAEAPNYCGNGKPPEHYLPLFFWGDKAGDFSFLTAYVTESAFTNPASQLKVLDVTLSPATKAERNAFKKTGTKNIVPLHHNPFLRNADQKSDELRVGCSGFERIPVLPGVKTLVDAEWPIDHPLYWRIRGDVYSAVPEIYYKSIHSEYLMNFTFGDGTGAFQNVNYDVVPIDFDFFHNVRAELIGRNKEVPRPWAVLARVVEANKGMLYCGFYPDNFAYVDTIFHLIFRDGDTNNFGGLGNIVKENILMFKLVSLKSNIERGKDVDD